jgi:hypothetical protein
MTASPNAPLPTTVALPAPAAGRQSAPGQPPPCRRRTGNAGTEHCPIGGTRGYIDRNGVAGRSRTPANTGLAPAALTAKMGS